MKPTIDYSASIAPWLITGFFALSALPACAILDAMDGDDAQDTRSEDVGNDIGSEDIVDEPDASIDEPDTGETSCPTNCGASACSADGACIDPVSITTGHNHACALFSDDSIRCWGDNSSGQLGRPLGEAASSTPKKVDFGDTRMRPTQVSAGGEHTCAILKNGTQEAIYCWGQNADRQLGNTEADELNPSPVQVALDGGLAPQNFHRVETGARHSCLLTNEPRLVTCWGDDSNAQSGNSSSVGPITKPTLWVKDLSIDANGGSTLKNVAHITSQSDHTCIIDTSNALKCWGANQKHQLGLETSPPHQQPFANPPNWSSPYEPSLKAIAVAAGVDHTCALLTPNRDAANDRQLYCWGANPHGQSNPSKLSPISHERPTRILPALANRSTLIAAGAAFSCMTHGANSTVICFGKADKGQIGEPLQLDNLPLGEKKRGTPIESNSGISLDHVEALDAGASYACALRSNTAGRNEVWCWGDNSRGQLGVELSESDDDCSDAESCSKAAFRVDFSR